MRLTKTHEQPLLCLFGVLLGPESIKSPLTRETCEASAHHITRTPLL
jgi:hypothetical protein